MIWSWALFQVRTPLLLIRLCSEEIDLWSSNPQAGSWPGSASWTSPKLPVSFCCLLEFILKLLLSFSASQLPLPVTASTLGKTQLQMLVHLFDFPSFPGSWLFNSLPTYLVSDTFRNVVFMLSPDFFRYSQLENWPKCLPSVTERGAPRLTWAAVSALWSLTLWLVENFVVEPGGLGSLSWGWAERSLSNCTAQHIPFNDEEIDPEKARGVPRVIQSSDARTSPGIWISWNSVQEYFPYTRVLGGGLNLGI